MNLIEFYLMNPGTYPYIPSKDDVKKSIYVSLPNAHYRSFRGQNRIEQTLETLVYGESLGFDGILTAEHHGTPVGVSPSANMTIAWLAARTRGIRLGAMGPIMNSYLTPVRLAEEIALLDVMSRGRTFFGLPMGVGMNYHSFGVMDPTHARTRFREGHELMVKAFTDEGPFEWQGEYFHVPYVNLWPKPIQQPHPPIWIPSAGSLETLDLVAKHHYTYLALFSPVQVLVKNANTLRECANKYGYELDRNQIVLVISTYVAETDAQARREAEPHLLWRWQNMLRSPAHDSFPPGHMTVASYKKGPLSGGYRSRDISEMSFDDLITENWVIVGSPSTVAEKIDALTREVGAGRYIMSSDTGTMPEWMVRKSLALFAEEVIPRFREADGRPIWERERQAGYSTLAEYGARKEDVLAVPRARVPGQGLVDVRMSHLADGADARA